MTQGLFKINMESRKRGGVKAVVEYDYEAKARDELTLVKGDVLHSIKQIPGGWWEGTLASTGKSGMFPDNFVRVIDPDDKTTVVLRDKSATMNRRCKVVFSYTQNNDDELTLAVGDIIEFLEEVEEGWWRGKLSGKTGVFPSNFVVAVESTSPVLSNRRNSTSGSAQVVGVSSSTGVAVTTGGNRLRSLNNSREDLNSNVSNHFAEKDAPVLPPKPVRELCKVRFPYEAANEDELELKEGDIITILSKDLPDKGWWRGELRGNVGVFPDNFVAIISSADAAKEASSAGSLKPDRPPSAKVLLNKSPTGTNLNSHRKSSFGSKDSLNDSGIIKTGSVAAHRKSLETKHVEVASVRKSTEVKMTASDIRKSLENLDDKNNKTTPPPIVTKKPMVPQKKSPNSVAANLFSGLKSKVKGSEHKLVSQDSLDGIVGSKQPASQIADNSERGVKTERMNSTDEAEFDQVERASILPDMRAGRAKAPKRRPPTAGLNSSGDSSMNSSNNSHMNGSMNESTQDTSARSDEDELAKPKPREWEKQKAPWMAELKASQAKKTSPIADASEASSKTQSMDASSSEFSVDLRAGHEKHDMSKSFSSSFVAANQKNKLNEHIEVKNNASSFSKDIQSESTTTSSSSAMTKSMSAATTKISISMETSSASNSTTTASIVSSSTSQAATTDVSSVDVLKGTRISSAGIRNRSISPIGRRSQLVTAATVDVPSGKIADAAIPVSPSNVCSRVTELESRVLSLERIVQEQSNIIDKLRLALKDETDRVRNLKGELDKYAQCVTQV